MKTTIAEIKKLPIGTELKGFPLLIKTARAAFTDGEKKNWQEVVFMDASGEMIGQILLPESKENAYSGRSRIGVAASWKSKTNLCIMQATIQMTEDRNRQDTKLVVTDCFDTATPLTYDQQQDLTADEWQRLHVEEIEGKIRHGLTIAWVQATKRLNITLPEKKMINELVEFVKHG